MIPLQKIDIPQIKKFIFGKCTYSAKFIVSSFLNKFEMKLRTEHKYIYDIEGRMSFRRAIWHQISCLVKAVESEDSSLYHPITIR